MTGHEKPDKPTQKVRTNPKLVVVLIGAIIAVLGVGIWLVATGRQPATSDNPTLDSVTDLGEFYMPAGFDSQDILFLGGDMLAAECPGVLAAIVTAVVPETRVRLLFGTATGRTVIDSLVFAAGLSDLPLEFQQLPQVALRVRDFGPLTVTDLQGRRSLAAFVGDTDEHRPSYDDMSTQLSVRLDLPLLSNGLRLAGGDVVTNGRGLGVLSSQVVKANVGYRDKKPQDIVQTVAAMLGFEKVLLVDPLIGEPTGHVDLCCAFLAPDLVVVGSLAPDVDVENSKRLDWVATDLAAQHTLNGQLRVERVRQPDHADGIWRSYTSIVFANGVVLVPIYPDYCPDLDEEALSLYRRLLPEREVFGIDASCLARKKAALLDITMNVPRGEPPHS